LAGVFGGKPNHPDILINSRHNFGRLPSNPYWVSSAPSFYLTCEALQLKVMSYFIECNPGESKLFVYFTPDKIQTGKSNNDYRDIAMQTNQVIHTHRPAALLPILAFDAIVLLQFTPFVVD
jgi:hypothetical protein